MGVMIAKTTVKRVTVTPVAMEYAKALAEYAEGVRPSKPAPPPGLTAVEAAAALKLLGHDPRAVAEKVRERASVAASRAQAAAGSRAPARWEEEVSAGGRDRYVIELKGDGALVLRNEYRHAPPLDRFWSALERVVKREGDTLEVKKSFIEGGAGGKVEERAREVARCKLSPGARLWFLDPVELERRIKERGVYETYYDIGRKVAELEKIGKRG